MVSDNLFYSHIFFMIRPFLVPMFKGKKFLLFFNLAQRHESYTDWAITALGFNVYSHSNDMKFTTVTVMLYILFALGN